MGETFTSETWRCQRVHPFFDEKRYASWAQRSYRGSGVRVGGLRVAHAERVGRGDSRLCRWAV
jgi:hypothetical protein